MLRIVAAVLFLALASPAWCDTTWPNQREGDVTLKDFRFGTGEILPELKLHYITLGSAKRNTAGEVVNGVLLLHGTGGTSKRWLQPALADELFSSGAPLDAEKFFIVIPDGIGRGGSSKPSDGLRMNFPYYRYTDMVIATHQLLTQHLGINHLRLVLGSSMGGMQAWMWGERWPEMMDALMPIASQPVQISGRNLVWRRLVAETIRHDPDWKGGDYDAPPRNWTYAVPVFLIMTDSPVRLQKQGPTRKEAEALYDKTVEEARKKFDANDYLYWYESSWDYDPEPDLPRIKARLLAVNFADDEINPPETGVMERAMPKVKNGRFVLVPRGDKTIGHQTLTLASVWKPYLEELLRDAPRAER
jgi:homoserine O-acetyltransferase